MKDEPGSCSFSLVQYSKPKVICLEIGTSQGISPVKETLDKSSSPRLSEKRLHILKLLPVSNQFRGWDNSKHHPSTKRYFPIYVFIQNNFLI